jgi:hypothetical protein
MRRSSLGGHIAGTGIVGPTSKEFDDFTVERGVKVRRPGMFDTDKFKDKKEFEKYVREMSGDVKIYNLKKDVLGTSTKDVLEASKKLIDERTPE